MSILPGNAEKEMRKEFLSENSEDCCFIDSEAKHNQKGSWVLTGDASSTIEPAVTKLK